MTTKDVGARNGRHLDFLAFYVSMPIEHHPKTSHRNGDGMSHLPSHENGIDVDVTTKKDPGPDLEQIATADKGVNQDRKLDQMPTIPKVLKPPMSNIEITSGTQ